ncbi:DUF2249 domain-containing protein [Aminobacter sp. NyZ550]|uniref:Uncharacterized protein (DUF2249 family) n=2 Tax=Aminobacter TaxID=31988 RepID=A0AAC8YT08_AMIAI|nr:MULTISPECIES: DUF2249 domain-containing protein [Aminobacter]AMS43938.1 hypothetical protein AA2016_5030 [Aminobacter aminovorans]MBA8909695.1 uncharacterized protein (DUF2249 family) [Aminobacter ciceronei]MBA9023451.1 uncharacterized protein (DUF2249 family) [Aminobacter ciceronei]MBB3705675.1 uncharacterized protein (DUF2249 family) [Aminobacter aminovorans]MDR7224678.1 uncharacterized protein (DUF2249 family) [Aminobacter aminovorans]
MTTTFVDLDVRPLLAAGDEPFGKIMETVASLGPDVGLRLVAPFKPIPLLQVLASRGFDYEAREIGDGDWEVLFRPSGEHGPVGSAEEVSSERWPEPVRHLDNRDLEPPEPMVRILAEVEQMAPGEVMSALLGREPVFLFPELEKRGHRWKGGFDSGGTTYRLLVWINAKERVG